MPAGREILTLTRIGGEAPLDLVEIGSETLPSNQTHEPLAWFGPEVTGDPGFEHVNLALPGPSHASELPVSDASFHLLLDILDALDGSTGAEPITVAEASELRRLGATKIPGLFPIR
jgi:hypothetical protein